MPSRLLAPLFILALFFICHNAHAMTTTWTGSMSDDFLDDLNWDNNAPTSGVDAIVPSGTFVDPVLRGNASFQSLTLTAVSTSLTLTINNGVTMEVGVLDVLPGAGAGQGITINLGGTLEINGGGSSTSSLNSTVNSSTTITGSGTFLTTTGDTLEINAHPVSPILIDTITLTLAATTDILSGQLTIVSPAATAGSVNITSNTTPSVLLLQTGSMSISALDVNASATHIATLSINAACSVTVTTTCDLNCTATFPAQITGNGSFEFSGTQMTVNGTVGAPADLPVSAALIDGNFLLNAGTMNGNNLVFSDSTGSKQFVLNAGTLLSTASLDLQPPSTGDLDLVVNTGAQVQVTTLFRTLGATGGCLVSGDGTFTLNSGADMTIGSSGSAPVAFTIRTVIIAGDLQVANADLQISGGAAQVFSIRGTKFGSGATYVSNTTKLTVEMGGQIDGTFYFDDNCTIQFDTTQSTSGTLNLITQADTATPAILTGTGTIFGGGFTVNITADSPSNPFFWQVTSGLRNEGTINLDGSVGTGGVRLRIPDSSNFTNAGDFTIFSDTSGQGAIVRVGASGTGAFINDIGGVLMVDTGITSATVDTIFTNLGTIRVDDGSLFLNGASFTQSNSSALIRVDENDELTIAAEMTINDGTVKVDGDLTTPTLNLNNGVIEGFGTIHGNVNNSNIVRPGGAGSASTLTIAGDYSQTFSQGGIEIELASDSSYDKLVVQGNITLNHEINFKLLGAYVPAANFVFTGVLEIPGGQSRTGAFNSLIQNDVGKGVYFAPVYTGNDVNIRTKTLAVAQAQSINAVPAVPFNGTLTSTDADGDTPTYLIQSQPSKGTVTITNSATGAFTYTATAGATGSDSFVFKVDDGTLFSNHKTVTIALVSAVAPPVIASATPSPNPAKVGSTVTFTAVASDPASLPLTYSWDFQDGQPHTMGNPITHVFPNPGSFTVILRVFNGTELATMNVSIDVLGPNSGAETIINVGDGKDPVANPLNGITLSIASSNGGVVELAVDINALVREGFDVDTGFDTIKGRQANRKGLRPTNKFVEPGVAVATTVATDAGTTTERGKARRQIAVSSREVGQVAPFTTPPVNRTIETQSMKGKFLFSSTKPDQFTFVGAFELPEGLDITQDRTLEIGIGNVVDSVTISAKGKSSSPVLNRINKAQIKYPKLAKGATLTTAGQKAKLTLTMKGVNFSSIGFDTEGIAATLRGDEAGLKAVPRSIQTAISFGGSTWEGAIPVDFKLAKKADSGTIQGRRAN